MAIIISEERKQFNWLPFLILGILLILAIVGAYLLFFTEAPFIEYIAPSSQKRISDISAIESKQFISDLGSIKKDLQGKAKQQVSGVTSSSGSSVPVTNPGRTNPFLNF